jgi:hypothetical protein
MPAVSLVLSLISTVWLIAITTLLIIHRKNNKSPVLPFSSKIRFGLVKYNPFPDTGGEQSFTLSLLDGDGDGILFTSLHGREATRTYVKKIKQGESDQKLSAEERMSLSQALEKYK